MRPTPALLALALLTTGAPAALIAAPASAVEPGDPAVTGRFASPFEESGDRCVTPAGGDVVCKPAAGSINTLPNGKLVYWDALDSIQQSQVNTVAEFGDRARNDSARMLDLRGAEPTWKVSDPDPASNPDGREGEYLPGGAYNDDETRNDGDLFCSDQIFLADGTILDVGGTHYYQEPGVPGQPQFGVVELEGLTNSRLYDGESNLWKASGEMTYGRWYPSVVTLPDSRVLTLSGVTKLLKPVYPDRPLDSGRNVTQSEVYDPKTGEFTVDGGSKSMPLYPRIHLLPNGHVYYDAGGQTFNPAGQAYDEALWNTASSYDPTTQTWTELGLPAFGTGLVGFRGSAFSAMLPLRPNANGEYDKVQTLSAGGVYGVSPGTYVGTDTSTLNTISFGPDGSEKWSTEATSALNNPRWFSTGVSLPNGEVVAFSGADRDEVVGPGTGTPVLTPELYNPETKKWTELTAQSRGRTYHNTGILLPDGRVLVGGHAPITTAYAVATSAGQENLGLSNPNRDPSFEIFEPPNLFYGPRPVITKVDPTVKRGGTITVTTPDAKDASSVVLMRNTALTHLVDADQRTVELPIVARSGDQLTLAVTDNAAVLPDGPYQLVLNKRYDKGETPSVSRQMFVGSVPERFADDIAVNNAATVASETAARNAALPSAAQPVTGADRDTDGAAQDDAPQTTAARAGSSTLSGSRLPATGASTVAGALAVMVLTGSALLARTLRRGRADARTAGGPTLTG